MIGCCPAQNLQATTKTKPVENVAQIGYFHHFQKYFDHKLFSVSSLHSNTCLANGCGYNQRNSVFIYIYLY